MDSSADVAEEKVEYIETDMSTWVNRLIGAYSNALWFTSIFMIKLKEDRRKNVEAFRRKQQY